MSEPETTERSTKRHARPVLLVSRCLGFDHCRHDGAIIEDDYVQKLARWTRPVLVCPEVSIGLGTPRDPIRIVRQGDQERLVQPKTERDLTADMEGFARRFLADCERPDGVILKGRSPSCAITDTKIWAPSGQPVGRGAGTFGRAVLSHFVDVPVVDEGRLKNFTLREHFYTTIFTLAAWREIEASDSMARLVEFHASLKFLLMAHSEKHMRELGQIVANHERLSFGQVAERYRARLIEALRKPASYKANVNALQHAFGYCSKHMQARERKHFLEVLERYRQGMLPLSGPLALLRSYIVRFEEPYLDRQRLFDPFPEELIEITDSGKGRNR